MKLFTLSLTLIGVAFAIMVGIWLDQQASIAQTALIYISFLILSGFGYITSMGFWADRVFSLLLLQRISVIIVILIAWRVAYFPIMVLAGWFATISESLCVSI